MEVKTFLYADRSGEAGKKEGTRLGLSVVIAVSVHSCLLLKTLFSLYTWKIEVAARKSLKKEEVPLAKLLPPVFVCMGCTRERDKAAEIRMSSIGLGPTNQCQKDSIDRWSTSTEVCTLTLSSKLLVSLSKRLTPGHMSLWRCVGWSGDMATTGLRSYQIA